MNKRKKNLTYKTAGVDLDAGISITKDIGRLARSTFNRNVLTEIGSFGGLFRLEKRRFRDPVLVGSTDGVGTKVILAAMTGRIGGTGEDLVNHCVNDILVQGASPLFFLDYIAFPRFSRTVVVDVIRGLSKACRENGCVLLGGETAEMPDVYHDGHYDIAGTIVGVVERDRVVDGSRIRPGDVLIGLASSGLHTNGYSLARKALLTGKSRKEDLRILNRKVRGSKSVADLLLAPHRSYLGIVSKLMSRLTLAGMAHITGGGFDYNIVRILPEGTRAVVDVSSWTPPFIFRHIREQGGISRREMYDVFNMGIGMVLFVRPGDAPAAFRLLEQAGEEYRVIGRVEKQRSGRSVVLPGFGE
jgi:phosphoribosylformylglycinamidine cyclo-ligase